MKTTFLLFMIVATCITKPLFAAKDSSFISIRFNNKVDSNQLELGKTYYNSFEEEFTVARLKYYISNFTFYKVDGTNVNTNSYFLVNEEDSSSKSLAIPLQAGSYNKVSFLIGVDSIKNVSGTQTDALDPMNGMFWTWNSGYIMAKLEGTSPLSKSPNNLVEYHIGGFRSSQNTVRKVVLSFPANDLINENNKQAEIVIEANINKWFTGAHELKIAAQTACTTPGDLAVKYADNYANMFTITSLNYSAKPTK